MAPRRARRRHGPRWGIIVWLAVLVVVAAGAAAYNFAHEADEILNEALARRADDAIDEERFQFLALALGHVRQAIDRRREMPRKAVLKAAQS
jgi:hypothetical protein